MKEVKSSMNKISNYLKNLNFKKTVAIFGFIVLFSMVGFLTISLVKYYYENVKKDDEIKLYYEFGPNTISYDYDETTATSDIGEQFLSYGVSYGVDVSEWQGEIDWEKVKRTGISFAIIRCGFREISGSEVKEDDKFRMNIEGATKAGLKVGVYFFGTAKNEDEAKEEAEFTINLIKDYNITYPVVYDTESFGTGRLKNTSNSILTDNILTFTETIGSYGYETMVYSYHNAFTYMLDTGKLEGKLIWLAHYTDKTNYKGNYNMWQYTSEGKVDGIKTKVDLNVSYFTYVDDASKIVQNPRYIQAPQLPFVEVEETVTTKKETIIRTGPTDQIPNRLATVNRNTTFIRTGIHDVYSRIIYNGREAYCLTENLKVSDP